MPTFMHINPDHISFDTFLTIWLGLNIININERLQSLVDFWHQRHNPQILFFFFEDMVTDHSGTLSRLQQWMKLSPALDTDTIERVRQQTTHKLVHSVFSHPYLSCNSTIYVYIYL
jgi:hypothetical protein